MAFELPRDLIACLEHNARTWPDKPALIQHEDGRVASWSEFANLTQFFALRLRSLGVVRGDRVATQLPLFPEHVALMYACFSLGAICAPLDLRLKDSELARDLSAIEPKVLFHLGQTQVRDFRTAATAVRAQVKSIEHFVQVTPNAKPDELAPGSISITELMSKGKIIALKLKDVFTGALKKEREQIKRTDHALIIFTTGTTGAPKPALLTHENILVQNEITRRGLDMTSDFRVLVNLPPSHVGCVTECLMTTVYAGGTAVLLRIFDVQKSLEAIAAHKVTVMGMIPTQFRMLWDHPDWPKTDLSSLRTVVYAGAAVDRPFLERVAKMAPHIGTGLGMTENAGFATFTPKGIPLDELETEVGSAYDDLAKVSVRAPMQDDGRAGAELPDGETGEICYHPPIVFPGYFKNPEETRRAISTEGLLYTGDLGFFEQRGSRKALRLQGRRKFIVKQKGYNVFPDEVAAFLATHPKVAVAEV
ncbi:MAG: acyl--CoA ligase, partial [Deltaproteobacteria bacterium]|nr:acyl--CoA ligase [Deltaproteobacteria bacterium]